MKKFISIVLALTLVCAFAGCGHSGGNGESPEGTIKTFCEALRDYDLKKVASTIKNGNAGDLDPGKNMPEAFAKYLKQWAGKLTYKIDEVSADSENASVTVTMKYTDASAPMAAAVKATLSEAIKAAMSGEVSQEKMMSILMECIEKALKENKTSEATLTATFKLVQTADGWKITDVPPSVVNAATFNIMGVFSNLGVDIISAL